MLSAAGAALTGKAAFDYNRENFMVDREMRMKKEFFERKMRVKQAELWREDVRDFISLTEKKMSIYLLVNSLLLGFNVNLWCEGRLPEGTPDWLMMGNQVATGSSFTFLLLTVWLAMHASVAAQSYQTRILTQLVRLPLPTWSELEACRTHASEFEKVEPRQMFRIPFLAGSQESIAQRSASSAAAGAATRRDGTGEEAGGEVGGLDTAPGALPPATDPWGLEQRSDDLLELGCHHGEEVATLRHIKLVRQAAVYYQTYDAFARVSMSVGVNQLMLAMSYYILGYAMLQVQAPVAAIAGVIILMGCSEIIARIDLTLPVWDQRLITALLVFGPTVACLASYHYVQNQDMTTRIAECLAPVAFISHGIVIALMTLVLSVREQENGAMLPLAFQGVLYLDVFGWVSHKRARDAHDPEKLPLRSPSTWKLDQKLVGAGPAEEVAQPATPELPSRAASRRRLSGTPARLAIPKAAAAGPGSHLGHFAKEYMEPSACAGVPEGDEDGASDEEAQEQPEEGQGPGVARPAAVGVSYDEAGRPLPSRPLGVAPPSASDDMRHVEGAPRAWDHVNAVEPPAKGFWDPVTFMPQENRRRAKMDSLISDARDQPLKGQERASFWGFHASREEEEDEGVPIATGHDNEMPGVLPWRVFRNASFVVSLTWILAGVYYILHVTGVWTMALPWNEKDVSSKAARSGHWSSGSEVVPRPGMFSLLAAGVTLGELGPEAERIWVQWPYADIQPQTLACDVEGRRLLATDGLSIFEATLPAPDLPKNRAVGSPSSRQGGDQTRLSAKFLQAPGCSALQGEALQDVAFHCGAGGDCEALALHHDGMRLAACPLAAAAAAGSGDYVGHISEGWLQRPVQGAHGRTWRREHAHWLLVDQGCAASSNRTAAEGLQHGGCVSVATTHGRLAQLTRHAAGHELVPMSIVEDQGTEHLPAEATRAFNDRYFGVLHSKRHSIRVMDADSGAEAAGLLPLPSETTDVGAFCVGGGHVYLLGGGHNPGLWRIPLPPALLRGTSAPEVAGEPAMRASL